MSRGPLPRPYYVKPVPGLLRMRSIRNLLWESQFLVNALIFSSKLKLKRTAVFGTARFTGCTRSWPKIPPTHWLALPRRRRARHVSRRRGHAATITDADGPNVAGPVRWDPAGPVLSSSVAAVGESSERDSDDGDGDSDNYEAYPSYWLLL